ncbi:MAG: fused MFS/spermidine synthase [Peptococcaceae bacterium]|jgi:predicted membrane-bound spermidine synthase|nr:fused MFS/spermidine synthase [Peptococcaceae bacterium]
MSPKKRKQSAAGSPLMKNRYFLYATSFFSGMSVMAIELGASRLLAPYFSSSMIVWTVIIGVIMIALALGNVIGGRLADKNPDPLRLYRRLLLAALWTAAIPFAGKYVIAGVSLGLAMVIKTNFLIWASFISCFLVFVFPLILLGTVSPSLIKYSVLNLRENGKVVGELSAISTIGSIIGTFLPTFVTIPTVGTAATFLIFAGILALISLIYFLSVKKYTIRNSLLLIIILGFLFFPMDASFAFWETNLLYEGESVYNYLQVKDTPDSIIMSTNVLEGIQSIMMKDDTQLTGLYFEYALAGPLIAGLPMKGDPVSGTGSGGASTSGSGSTYSTGADRTDTSSTGNPGADRADSRVLMLGLGTGTYATQVLRYFPEITFEGVEIDEKIVRLAEEFFRLPEDVVVSVNDGRAYLQDSGMYDVILVDAYQDITIPFQMSSREFFTMVSDHLNEGAVMMVNLNMHSAKEGSINDYICDTIASIYPYVYTMPTPRSTNAILLASYMPDMLERLQARTDAIDAGSPLKRLMLEMLAGLQKREAGPLILTDDKAPVELLGMKVIDEIIAGNLSYYQNVLEREGLGGLLRSMGLSG